MVSGICSINRFCHPDMTRLVFPMGRLRKVYMPNRCLLIWEGDVATVSNATRRIAKALDDAPHWQILETFRNTVRQQNNIRSIISEAHTMEILKEVCRSNGPRWILHAETSTRFQNKSKRLNPIFSISKGQYSRAL
jgi:hypothetical protein